jgi:thiol:disulfide interchange protein DsbD
MLPLSAHAISFGEQSSFSFSNDPVEFLTVDEAFKFTTEVTNKELIIHWSAADDYYLYLKRFNLLADNKILETHFDQTPELIDDPGFGSVKVFYHNVTQRILLANIPKHSTLELQYQGCADAGLCYPPETQPIVLSSPTYESATSLNNVPTRNTNQEPPSTQTAQGIHWVLENASFFNVMLLFFVIGLGLTFTPCVLPMIPILSSIIVGQKDLSTRKAFFLSLSYVLGMASIYALAGVIVGLLGASFNIQSALQNPWVLMSTAGFFVVLSLSMFGLYDIRLPQKLQDKLNNMGQKQQGGTYLSVFAMGALSALVVSPCVSPALAGSLTYIGATGDAALGGSALLMMGLGMGVPLMIIGVGGGKFVPKAGAWMQTIKEFFGVMLLGVSLWLLERLIPGEILLLLISILLGVYAIQLGALDSASAGVERVKKGLAIIMLMYAGVLMLGSFTQGTNPLNPLKNLSSSSTLSNNTVTPSQSVNTPAAFTRINNLKELQAAIKTAGDNHQMVMFDFYADWCISCKIMEHNVFSDPNIKSSLNDFVLLQVDMTDNTADHKALLDHFGLFGPPSILFFSINGEEILDARIQGDMNLEQFTNHLDQFLL